jgi:hypothetical protein
VLKSREKRGGHGTRLAGLAIQKKGGCLKCFNPEYRWHRGMKKECMNAII